MANGQSISSTAQLKNDDGFSLKLDRNDKYNWNYTGQLSKEYRQFAPALNMTEYTRYMDLKTIFKSAIEAFNITYLLEGGQVLGLYWFHGFIPWDDDFDCKVNVSQKHILKKALTDVSGHIVQPMIFGNSTITVLRRLVRMNISGHLLIYYSSRTMELMYMMLHGRSLAILIPDQTYCR